MVARPIANSGDWHQLWRDGVDLVGDRIQVPLCERTRWGKRSHLQRLNWPGRLQRQAGLEWPEATDSAVRCQLLLESKLLQRLVVQRDALQLIGNRIHYAERIGPTLPAEEWIDRST